MGRLPHGPFESNLLGERSSTRNLLVAEATAKEIGRISLPEALELTVLIAYTRIRAGIRA